MKLGDLADTSYSDLGIPIGAQGGEPLVTDYGQADLRPFAMGALAQHQLYQPYQGDIATGTTPWKKLDIEAAQRDTPPDITNLDPPSAKWLGQQAADFLVPTEPWEYGALAMGPAGRVAGKLGKAAALATGVYGSGVDEAEAMFGGRLAKTANLDMLKQAEAMLGRGASQFKIRQATGWFQGPDAKWRFEIPDTASKWADVPQQFTNVSPQGIRPHSSTAKLGNVFEHPELYEAYPQLHGVDLNVGFMGQSMKGSYQGSGGVPTISLAPSSPSNMRSTALHEIQHGIQDIEGFATGGNTFGLHTKSPGWDLYQERLKAIQTPATEKYLIESGVLGPEYTYADYLKEHQKITRDPDRMRMLDRSAQDYAVKEGYKRLAGEVEARNVQARADWTPGRLKNVPPWSETSQDVPYNKQIIRYPSKDPQLSADIPAAPEMGFGTATPGTFKNWLLRYSPESGAPELINATGPTGSVFSSLKTGASPQQMSRTLANEPAPYQHPLVDIADLQRRKASLVLGPTDRVYGGGDLTHVGGTKLETPVPQEGGINFPHLHRDAAIPGMPSDVAPLYASVSKGAASKANNAALRELEKGREPWYAPVIMGPGGSLSTNQVSNTVHQLLRQSEPSEAAIKIIDDAVRAKAAKAPGYPGFADQEKLQEWLNRGLAERRALTEGADTAAVLKATGVDVGHSVFANTDPRLYHTPSGSFGTMLGRMRPDVGVTEHPLHSNYPVTFFGQRGEIGGAAGNIPFALGAPDVHRALVPVLSPGGGSAATTPAMQVMRGGTKVQPVTQEVVDNWGEWFRRHPSGWMAAGAAPLGALAATDNYQPEERM